MERSGLVHANGSDPVRKSTEGSPVRGAFDMRYRAGGASEPGRDAVPERKASSAVSPRCGGDGSGSAAACPRQLHEVVQAEPALVTRARSMPAGRASTSERGTVASGPRVGTATPSLRAVRPCPAERRSSSERLLDEERRTALWRRGVGDDDAFAALGGADPARSECPGAASSPNRRRALAPSALRAMRRDPRRPVHAAHRGAAGPRRGAIARAGVRCRRKRRMCVTLFRTALPVRQFGMSRLIERLTPCRDPARTLVGQSVGSLSLWRPMLRRNARSRNARPQRHRRPGPPVAANLLRTSPDGSPAALGARVMALPRESHRAGETMCSAAGRTVWRDVRSRAAGLGDGFSGYSGGDGRRHAARQAGERAHGRPPHTRRSGGRSAAHPWRRACRHRDVDGRRLRPAGRDPPDDFSHPIRANRSEAGLRAVVARESRSSGTARSRASRGFCRTWRPLPGLQRRPERTSGRRRPRGMSPRSFMPLPDPATLSFATFDAQPGVVAEASAFPLPWWTKVL